VIAVTVVGEGDHMEPPIGTEAGFENRAETPSAAKAASILLPFGTTKVVPFPSRPTSGSELSPDRRHPERPRFHKRAEDLARRAWKRCARDSSARS